jgi:uncharacterized protein YecE (DUF72 family)
MLEAKGPVVAKKKEVMEGLQERYAEDLNLLHCVDPLQRPSVWGERAYFRLHGRTGYRYRYTDEDLDQLLEWCRLYPEGCCLFNNISMFENALRMKELLDG